MKSNGRSVVAMILLFTGVAVAMLWGLNERSQDELSEQVMARAAQRSVQLADAMAGQVASDLTLMDHLLLDTRQAWLAGGDTYRAFAEQKLASLPPGLVSHISVANADGLLVYSSRGIDEGLDIKDRPHFNALRSGADRMMVGIPLSSPDNIWMVPVGRPLYREGQFAGAIYLLIFAESMAEKLGRVSLDGDDVAVLLDDEGRVLARSVDNAAGMGQAAPSGRPFLQNGAPESGVYWQNSVVDKVHRVFGWHRLPSSGLVMVVGLAEASILAPMATSMARSRWITGTMSALLLAGGFVVAWLLWRDGRSALAVRESEHQLKEAQRTAKVGHMSQNLRTGKTVWSDEMYRIFGYAAADPGLDISKVESIYARVHPEDLPSLRAALEASIQRCEAVELLHRIVLPGGRVKHLRVQSLVTGENGVPMRGSATVQDITEVRESQLALEAMNGRLEALVEGRTAELALLIKELEAFTYSVSHDLRTPLRSIHGFASLLEDESDHLSAEGRIHLRRIQEGARRMGLLITDLLTMAHQSRAVVSVQELDMSELAQAVVQDIEREDPARKVNWHIGPGLSVWADPVLMRVVLQNLLGNAWKYTGQADQAEVWFERVGSVGGKTEYCVRDNGAGFDMAYVDQLFQPFKRLHAHHEFEGSGVGLASVHRLVQRHGGSVRAEGKVGAGAAVYFTLPDEPAAAGA